MNFELFVTAICYEQISSKSLDHGFKEFTEQVLVVAGLIPPPLQLPSQTVEKVTIAGTGPTVHVVPLSASVAVVSQTHELP